MPIIDILGVSHTYHLTPSIPASRTLVFIHGWLLSRHYWKPLIEQLATEYQCLSYDLRGFGESQPLVLEEGMPLSGYSLAAYAQDLGELLDRLHLSNVWLVGHSLGGGVALWGAHKFPEQVQGVVCINAGGGIYLKEEFERFRSAGQKIVNLRPNWLAQIPWLELAFLRSGTARSLSRQWARQRLIDFAIAHPAAAIGSLLESTTEAEVHKLPQIVAKLPQPVYFITGTQDAIMKPQYVRHLASFHPLFGECGDNVIELANCGHLAMVEHPTVVAENIRAILATSR